MKKILIIIPSIKKGGGAENVAVTIGNKLHEKGYKINYLTFYETNNKLDINGNYYCLNEKISKNVLNNFYKLFNRAINISKYCKKNNIEICISHLDEANFSNIVSKIFFKNKSKIIIEIHNSIEKSLNLLYFYVYKLIINFSDKIVSLTREDLVNYMNNFKNNKVINIYNPINIKKISLLKNEEINQLKINSDDFIFINIGRLCKQKNQKLLIKSFDLFNKKIKKSRLLILGEGELKFELENFVNGLQSKENITFLGRKDNPFKYIKRANYFVLTSNYEGLPVVLIESLTCGVPIISTDCKTGPREIININNDNYLRKNKITIGDCGILTPIGDEGKLVEAMELAYYNKNNIKDKFLKNIEKKVSEFDLDNIIKKWEMIIKK